RRRKSHLMRCSGFIPLIFSGGIWNFLLSTPRSFPAGTIGDTFYETAYYCDLKYLHFKTDIVRQQQLIKRTIYGSSGLSMFL
ncbi:MAG: hypothetical protein QNK40_14305, partial [Desulfobacterales bacterium]|nr:hypothetical protein [Desulfobacterales bacterium]MDX2510076.1 hypothetical protein [Desulfobacterales bacterium]